MRQRAEVSSSTGATSSLLALTANSAAKGWKSVAFVDVGQTLLNANLAGETVRAKADSTRTRQSAQASKGSECAGACLQSLAEEDDELKRGAVVVELVVRACVI